MNLGGEISAQAHSREARQLLSQFHVGARKPQGTDPC
jgi:hypothetical protein